MTINKKRRSLFLTGVMLMTLCGCQTTNIDPSEGTVPVVPATEPDVLPPEPDVPPSEPEGVPNESIETKSKIVLDTVDEGEIIFYSSDGYYPSIFNMHSGKV